MFARRRFPFLSYLLALLLVASQLLVTAHACAGVLEDMSSMPMSTHESMMSMEDMEHCDGMATADEISVTCKAHCQREAQSADNHVPSVQPPVLALLFFLSSGSSLISLFLADPGQEPSLLVATSPPLRIQYQVFRS